MQKSAIIIINKTPAGFPKKQPAGNQFQ